MLVIINDYLHEVTKTDDGFYIGYIDTAAKYNQFMAALKDAGFYFSVRDSERFRKDGQFLFKCNKSNVPVPFSGCPFRRERNITYQCAFGSQYYGKVKKKESTETVLETCEKKKGRVRLSKKIGCKAKMAAKCIRIYLDYKIPSETSHWRLKKEVISTLKQDLTSKECKVKSLSRYFIKISCADQHCHTPMHPRGVIKKLLETSKCKRHVLDVNEDQVLEAPAPAEGETNAYETVCMVGDKGELVDLRELCHQKCREVATLSQHLCHDEDQLREILTVLTRVTNRLHESQVDVVAGGVGEAESVASPLVEVIVENSMSFETEVSHSEMAGGETAGQGEEFIEDCSEETDSVSMSEALLEVSDRQLANAQFERLQKRLNINEPQVSSEHDLQQNCDIDEGNVIYYFIG
ncbi:uncharacterized protein LOC124158009 [Ischnura elegans]|uniref:uncharacterized protein LOC124158009 n=1 Tax=Ischnura elegans TaxID=197161 RepID=UPI001ED88134|nr:uncharacterized protein LOC124158009 [Ischnura elegans]